MIRVPGQGPFVPPAIPPKDGKKAEETRPEPQKNIPQAPKEGVREPALDARAIAVRMAALAHEAEEKKMSFEEIIQKVIEETGILNPQAALEEANRRLQKEIDEELENIKNNKDLMEEAVAWQEFASILEQELSQDQVQEFLKDIKDSIHTL